MMQAVNCMIGVVSALAGTSRDMHSLMMCALEIFLLISATLLMQDLCLSLIIHVLEFWHRGCSNMGMLKEDKFDLHVLSSPAQLFLVYL
jgi:hypothetical protein